MTLKDDDRPRRPSSRRRARSGDRAASPGRPSPRGRRGTAGGRPRSGTACRPRAWAKCRRSATGAENQPAVPGAEPGRDQPLAQRRLADGSAVDLRDDQLADSPIVDERVERPQGRVGDLRVVRRRQRLDRPAAALEVERRATRRRWRRSAPAARWNGRRSASPRRGQGIAAPYGLAGSAAARSQVSRSLGARAGSRTARSRSSAPASANWAAPSPSTK